jgi:hypothetical protein
MARRYGSEVRMGRGRMRTQRGSGVVVFLLGAAAIAAVFYLSMRFIAVEVRAINERNAEPRPLIPDCEKRKESALPCLE